MRYSHLVALTAYVEGREDDFNDWYTWVHLRDVMRLCDGVVAAQRFRRAATPVGAGSSPRYDLPYLCIYETTDAESMTRAHEAVFTDEMPISDAYSLDNACEIYFDEIIGATATPGRFPRADVVLERIQERACNEQVACAYAEQRFRSIVHLPGVIAGSCGVISDHQMFEQQDRPGLCTILWTSDLGATTAAWQPLDPISAAGVPVESISVDAYTAVTDRLTMLSVRDPSDADRETARVKRAALGNRVLEGPAPGVQSVLFD